MASDGLSSGSPEGSPDGWAAARRELAGSGTLRAGINVSNDLLVTGTSPDGQPEGVAPSMAGQIAARLGVALALVPYPSPGAVVDAAGLGKWDIGLIGDAPGRDAAIRFTPAYVEIQATYLLPAGSRLTTESADQAGVTIAVDRRTAYELWLTANMSAARILLTDSKQEALAALANGSCDAVAGLRPALLQAQLTRPDTVVAPGRFTAVQQAVGTPISNRAGAAFLRAFVEEAKASGLVADLLRQHQVSDRLSVAAPTPP